MARLDREILTRRIRDAVDISELIGGYLSLRRAGAGLKGLCPFHEEKTPSFTVSPAHQTFKCFGCGAGGDVFTFVQMKENVDFLEARRILADRAGVPLEADTSEGPGGGPGKRELAQVNEWAQGIFRRYYEDQTGESVRQYVADRGLSVESANDFGMGLALDSYDGLIREARSCKIDLRLLLAAGLVKERSTGGYYDTFRNRLMFPIRDASQRIVGFGGRALGDDPAKYMNTPATALFDKSKNLFGLDRARQGIDAASRAIVVEGYTDCIMAHQFGFTETVATLGTAMTDAHASLLRRYTDRVILLFDSDEAGQRAADRALSVTLSSGLDVSLSRVPEGKDPCDYLLSAGKEAFNEVLKDAIAALEFKWERVQTEYDASASGPGRRRAIDAYLQQLSGWLGQGVIDPIQKGLLLNQLSKVLSLPVEELHRQLRRMTRTAGTNRTSSASRGVAADEPPAGGDGRSGRRLVNVDQEALRQIVEALLNEPPLYPMVAERFDPAAIRDAALSAVARELVAALSEHEEFRLDEFIGRFESPTFGRLITDLHARGERRGNCEAMIAGALECLDSYASSQQATTLAAEIRSHRRKEHDIGSAETGSAETGSAGNTAEQQPVPVGEDERLQALAQRARNPHFAASKARRRFLSE